MASASTSRCSPSTRPASTCACSTRPTPGGNRTGCRCANAPIRSGTGTSPRSARASSTATGCTGRTTCAPATASTPPSWSSTRTPSRWDATSAGTTACSVSPSGRPTRATTATTPPTRALASVVDPAFTWGDDRPLQRPWHETVIYELHVRGFTKTHPGVPEDLRGSYLGLASEASIEHLLKLGVTAVELLPVHHHIDDWHLDEGGPGQLLGLQHARLLRARPALLGEPFAPTARCASSSRWCGRCTRPASR